VIKVLGLIFLWKCLALLELIVDVLLEWTALAETLCPLATTEPFLQDVLRSNASCHLMMITVFL